MVCWSTSSNGLRISLLLSLLLAIVALPMLALPARAAESQITAAAAAGKAAGLEDADNAWYLAGCCTLGLSSIYVMATPGEPPAAPLVGKSPEYVAAYTDAFRETAKREKITKSLIGGVPGCVVCCCAVTVR